MMPPVAPVQQNRPGGPPRVIQGFFPGGQPRIPQAPPVPSLPRPAPVLARPARVQPAMVPGRPNPIQPSARPGIPAGRPQPILPTAARPGAVQAFAPLKPTAPQAILPPAARLACVQPSANQTFALPPGFQLRPSGLGQRLPEAVQQKMEAFFGTSFGDVRVHVGNEASSIGAYAFTHGNDLYFAPGQYNPQTPQGQQLLGHELTHVVQQRAGRVKNPLGGGIAVVQDLALEAEAERMGMRAASSSLPIQAKAAGTGLAAASSRARGLGPNSVASNEAILPASSLAQGSAQPKPGPIRPGNLSAAGNTVPDTFSDTFPTPLGHELTHVVQQRAGRVPNPFPSGVAAVRDRGMEAVADPMAFRVNSFSDNRILRTSGLRTVVQPRFSAGHARTFVNANAPADVSWPRDEPANWFAWFRAVRGVTRALKSDGRWNDDEEHQAESQVEIENALVARWRAIAADRAREAERSAKALAWVKAQRDVTAALKRHILIGDLMEGSEIPTGYHSKAGNSRTHEAYGTRTEIAGGYGVYQQSVRSTATWLTKPNQSTFFPDTVGARPTREDDIVFAVGTAMDSPSKTVRYPEEWRGMTLRKIGDTWFPTGGSD